MTNAVGRLNVIELCAGAGGQTLGLEEAGFDHLLALELDHNAAATLRMNLGPDHVREGDVADRALWDPSEHAGEVDLLAGGVPCPPFSLAGQQRGALDERDLFAWAVEQVAILRPRALLLENVRGLAMPRFSAYRQHVVDRLAEFGYQAEWRLLHASNFGVPQLRPRFVLIAMKAEHWSYFHWPSASLATVSVGRVLGPLMASNGWPHASEWAAQADRVAPTIVGGSKKHGGADLGPTRAKRAWTELGVDGRGIADAPPGPDAPHFHVQAPRLTLDMVAQLQGWDLNDARHRGWVANLQGGKTARYRQIGNAFPPPVARAVGFAIHRALILDGEQRNDQPQAVIHDPLYKLLREVRRPLTAAEITQHIAGGPRGLALATRMHHLERDFGVTQVTLDNGEVAYALNEFKAFIGQSDHARNEYLQKYRARIS